MDARQQRRILARRGPADLVGRAQAFDRLVAHPHTREGLALLATPGAGTSELLRHVYDRLFDQHLDVIPFYFQIGPTLATARDVAESFLNEFIRQLIAFRRREPELVRGASGLDELADLSVSTGGVWMDRLIETARNAPDGRAYLRTCLAAPIRAAAHEARPLVIVDDAQRLIGIVNGLTLLDELNDIFSDAGVPFIVAGHRRFLNGRINCERIEIDNLPFADAARLAEVLARESGVTTGEAACDLIATQLSGNASYIAHLISDARDARVSLDSFGQVEQVYVDSVLDGRIGRVLDSSFTDACRTQEAKRAVTEMLFDMQRSGAGSTDRSFWQRRLQLDEVAFTEILDRLNWRELIRLTPVSVELMDERFELRDHIEIIGRLAKRENRAAVFSDSLRTFLKRAPELMASRYRVNLSVGVREVLGAFAGQEIPAALLDYSEYRTAVKGATAEEAEAALRKGPSIALPRIFFTTAASAFYKPLVQLAEAERSAIALGFEPGGISHDEDVVWIAAEIESKLEASRQLTEFWCERLEEAAQKCEFGQFRIWLISPEGFSEEAIEVMRSRDAIGSSRTQVENLRQFIHARPAETSELAANEYEIVVPMEEDAELIAAHAVEEIARRHNLDVRAINQIKTALVEACINATEHSLSPDRKIYIRFRVEDDGVVLTVSNRGLRFVATALEEEDESPEGRRGWGLRLMRKLMDDVRLEQVDDGTRIVMAKKVSNS